MSDLRFYLDENISPAVTEQLKLREIDAVCVRDLNLFGDDDRNHLERATDMNRVLCTHDQDFLRLALAKSDHAGIVFAEHYGAKIGGWVKALRKLHAEIEAEEMRGLVKFVSAK